MITRQQQLTEMYKYLYLKGLVHSKKELSQALGMTTQQTLSRAFSGEERYLTTSLFQRINSAFGMVFSTKWINSGEGDMLDVSDNEVIQTIANYNSVPLDNFGTIEKINLGSLFPNATSAVTLNDSAFDIYPKGTILVLKEVDKERPLNWGKDYYIETENFSIARCIQKGDNCIIGYGYNHDKFPDGTEVFAPVYIEISDIEKIHQIIGAIIRN